MFSKFRKEDISKASSFGSDSCIFVLVPSEWHWKGRLSYVKRGFGVSGTQSAQNGDYHTLELIAVQFRFWAFGAAFNWVLLDNIVARLAGDPSKRPTSSITVPQDEPSRLR